MINNPEDQDRSVRTGDKLTYKIILQRKVDAALNALGSEALGKAVVALRTACFFNQAGLPFKKKIEAKLRELNAKRRDKILRIVNTSRDDWIHPIKRKIHCITLDEEYYTEELEFLIDMLASHNALLESKDFIEKGEQV